MEAGWLAAGVREAPGSSTKELGTSAGLTVVADPVPSERAEPVGAAAGVGRTEPEVSVQVLAETEGGGEVVAGFPLPKADDEDAGEAVSLPAGAGEVGAS